MQVTRRATRMSLSPRCSKKATGALSVKCLSPALLGLVCGRGLPKILGVGIQYWRLQQIAG
jgi:hypothetical protein